MLETIKIIFIKMLNISLILGMLIAAIHVVTPWLKKRYSARWRYWAWLLLAVWLLVPVTFTATQAPVQIELSDTAIVQPVAETPPAINDPQQGETPPVDDDPQQGGTSQNPVSPPADEAITFASVMNAILSRVTVLDILATVWLAGTVIVLFGRLVSALRFRAKLRRKWRPCDSTEVARCVRQTMESMGFHKELDIKFYKETHSPFVTGLFHPVLVLPDQDFDTYLLIHIIRHELTHYKRRDLWYKLIINALRDLFLICTSLRFAFWKMPK